MPDCILLKICMAVTMVQEAMPAQDKENECVDQDTKKGQTKHYCEGGSWSPCYKAISLIWHHIRRMQVLDLISGSLETRPKSKGCPLIYGENGVRSLKEKLAFAINRRWVHDSTDSLVQQAASN